MKRKAAETTESTKRVSRRKSIEVEPEHEPSLTDTVEKQREKARAWADSLADKLKPTETVAPTKRNSRRSSVAPSIDADTEIAVTAARNAKIRRQSLSSKEVVDSAAEVAPPVQPMTPVRSSKRRSSLRPVVEAETEEAAVEQVAVK